MNTTGAALQFQLKMGLTPLVHKLPVVTVDERYQEYGIEVLN